MLSYWEYSEQRNVSLFRLSRVSKISLNKIQKEKIKENRKQKTIDRTPMIIDRLGY
jgi:hypothetical protein